MPQDENTVPHGEIFVGSSNGIILGGFTLIVIWFIFKRVQGRGGKSYPPGPIGLPVFGNVFSLLFTKKQQHEVIDEWSRKYGPIFSFKLLTTRVYILSDSSLVQQAFQSPDVTDRMPFATNSEVFGRDNIGIVSSWGEVWKGHRRFFTTVFRKMDTGIKFEEIVAHQAKLFLQEVERLSNESFCPSELINMSVGNIITQIVMGVTYDYDDAEFRHIIECSTRAFDLTGPAGFFSLIPILSKIPSPVKTEVLGLGMEIMKWIEKSIAEHKARFDPNQQATDFMDCYLKEMASQPEQKPNTSMFDDLNLKVSCSDTILGGWETTTTSLLWVFFTLAVHQDIQDRVREEIVHVVGTERSPMYSHRHSMPFTEATIAESMRFHPAAAFHIPHVASCDCKIGGFDVPKGSAVTTNLWYLALSPTLWDQPMEFRPERFLDESGNFDRKHEALPFGYGRRICPGEQLARMELFMFTTYALQRFVFTLPDTVPRINPGKHGLTNRPIPYTIRAEKVTHTQSSA